MEETQLYTITIFTENTVGLLHQISMIFSRRCLNIESIAACACSIEGVHKYTLTCQSTRPMMKQVVKQIEKRIDVLKAYLHTDDEIIFQEVALYKVPMGNDKSPRELTDIVHRHHAAVLEMQPEYVVIEKTGHPDEIMALFEQLKPYGIRQFVRSGRVAIVRSPLEVVDDYILCQDARCMRIDSEFDND